MQILRLMAIVGTVGEDLPDAGNGERCTAAGSETRPRWPGRPGMRLREDLL